MSKHQLSYILFGLFTLVYVSGFIIYGWSLSYFIWFFIVWFLLIVYGSFIIQTNYHLNAINRVKTDEKKVAITFDDGPSSFTEKVLDILEKHRVKATFFCVGGRIEDNPEVFKSIIEKGHLVGNHTYSHSQRIGFSRTIIVKTEIDQTDHVIKSFTGSKPKFYRPPFGVTNPRIARAIKQTGHTVIGWNIRSLDTFIHDENKIFNRIVRQVKPGSIILLHDTSERSVNVLERLLVYLKTQNYQCVTVEELLKK
ncbi:MAG: polysaccharide deacetylase family protein [Brumimicrobium sp.]